MARKKVGEGLISIDVPKKIKDQFDRRIHDIFVYHLHKLTLSTVHEHFKQFGLECYLQGLLDGCQIMDEFKNGEYNTNLKGE